MNCIIIDKNRKTRSVIEKFIKQTSPLRLLKSCETADDAVSTLLNTEVDLVFLDVNMSGMDDINFIKNVDYNHSQLVVMASTRKFAKEAFDFNATDYLMQPVTRERFLHAISKARRLHAVTKVSAEANDMLFIKTDGIYTKLSLHDILYIKAMGDYVNLHCTDKIYTVKQTLKHVLGKLPADKFIRTHLSYIVNIEKVALMNDHLVLTNKDKVLVSRTYKKGLIKRMNLL